MGKNYQNIKYLCTISHVGTIYAKWEKNGKIARIPMKWIAVLAMFLCSMVLPMGADGETYKWVDEEGNLHFSDTPPPTGRVAYETIREVSSPSRHESRDHSRKVSSGSGLYSGKPLYYWRDQFKTVNSKIAMKRKDIRLLRSAIDKTDMYQPEKKKGMIIYPRELRVDGRLLNTRDQFIGEWTRQTEQLGELEVELRKLTDEAKLAGVPRWVYED
jgi:hypothetical protein